jgi:hypothetical protein
MSAWLHHLVAQSRGGERAVRPATSARRAPAFTANGDVPSIDSEAWVAAPATPARGNDTRLPEPRLERGSTVPDGDADGRRFAPSERAPPGPRTMHRDGAEDVVAQPVRSAPRRPPGTEDAVPRRDARNRSSEDERAPDRTAHAGATGDDTPRVHRETSNATIRPSLPARVAASIRAATALEAPAPLPDVHIHIGRLELTALTAAPAPRRERSAPAHRPMSLDEYLRRRNGGGR